MRIDGSDMNTWTRQAVILLASSAVLLLSNVLAQDEDDRANQAGEKEQRSAYLQAMQAMAAECKVVRSTDHGEVLCTMTKESVLNWADSARHPDLLVPGTCWIWHDEGRPQAIGEIYGRADAVGFWNMFNCSLSSDKLRFTSESRDWLATASYYEPKAIPNSTVAKSKAERTFQLKQLARRFDAHQFWDGERYELRLLSQPLYRYDDQRAGIIDGAIYALVHGTNPEVLLLIEAHQTGEGVEQWKVAFGSLAGARCVVRLDREERWSCVLHDGDPADPRQGFYREVLVK